MMRLLVTLSALLVAQGLPAQTALPQPAATAVAVPATVNVVLTTARGRIVLALEKERAPLTTAYFLKYVDGRRLDDSSFYRAYKVTPDGRLGLVQGGVLDPRKLLPPVAHEPTTRTGLSHIDGAISLARLAPGSATANFFIILGDLTSLDANPQAAGDNQGYAVFGRVVEGMDVVRAILDSPIDSAKGEGSMKGQMIAAPVKIVTARRLP